MSDRISEAAFATVPSEFRCDECSARCTETPQGTELGHRPGCPRRPAYLSDGAEGKTHTEDA